MSTKEEEKLCEAVDIFAAAMKSRLCAKAAEGYSGWDTDYPIDMIRRDLVTDAHFLRNSDNGIRTVDIANRAMMLRFRD